MVDQEIKQAYKKIIPSSELEHRILTMQVQPQRSHGRILVFKPLMTVAACLMVLLGSVLVTSRWQNVAQTGILLQDGSVLNEHALQIVPEAVDYVTSAMPRTATIDAVAHGMLQEGIAVDLHISSKKEVLLTVEEGILYVVSEEDGEEITREIGQSLAEETDGNQIKVRWVIPVSETDTEYRMIVGQKELVCIIYNAQTNEYFISRTDAEN